MQRYGFSSGMFEDHVGVILTAFRLGPRLANIGVAGAEDHSGLVPGMVHSYSVFRSSRIPGRSGMPERSQRNLTCTASLVCLISVKMCGYLWSRMRSLSMNSTSFDIASTTTITPTTILSLLLLLEGGTLRGPHFYSVFWAFSNVLYEYLGMVIWGHPTHE